MNDALSSLGFTTIVSTGARATHDEIIARYRGLIEDSGSDDTAVVYYSGHGGRQRNPLRDGDPSLPAWLQFLVPTDIDNRRGGRLRCILAQELSLLQLELTEKTPNVTTILDCCHSSRMSRDGGAVPKANDQIVFPWPDLHRRWEAVRFEERVRSAGADSNPFAIRVVGCSPNQSSYELDGTVLGGRHGALTAALVPVLTAPSVETFSWRQVLDIIRPAITDMVAQQRPEVEGPLHRRVFSLESAAESGVLSVHVEAGVALLEQAALFGMAVGDAYSLLPAGAAADRPLGTAVIQRVVDDRAVLRLKGVTTADLPPGISAHPLEIALGTRPVAILPLDHPDRAEFVSTLSGSPHVRIVEDAAGALATVRLTGDEVQVNDAADQPLLSEPSRISKDSVAAVVRDLRNLARATHVRNLASGTGPAKLAADVDVSYLLLAPDGKTTALSSGAHLFAGDRVVIRTRNRSDESRYVSTIDVGVIGAISILTTSEPDGVTLESGEHYELGRSSLGALEGVELFWPEAVPKDSARAETFITMVSDGKVNGLRGLEQQGIGARRGPATTSLERLLGDLTSGRRDARPPAREVAPLRYRVERFDFVLHPVARKVGDDEPVFELDERPDPSFRLVVPRAAGVPSQVALRLKDLTVHSNRSFLASTVRVDALVITAVPDGAGAPYQAQTARFDRIRDGDRLPFDDLLIYEGGVGRFIDLAVWVAKDDQRDQDLADLLAAEIGGDDVKGALATLAGLAVAAPQAALVAGSAAAVAVLVRTGARVIEALRGRGIGVYRTSLLPHQRFGAGEPPAVAARHPSEGLIRAQDMSFAYEVIDLDRA